MGENTKISWAHHTFNPWWGCTPVSPGCDNCYAKALDKRFGGDYWNPKIQPRRTGDQNWNQVRRWNRKAEKSGEQTRVFCGSMMDWCDNKVPDEWRADLWQLVRETPSLTWLMLTKRTERIAKCLPADWGDGYPNVWLGTTIEDQVRMSRVSILADIKAKVKFISAEPLLDDISAINLRGIDWVIIGGEAGPKCRHMSPIWVDNLICECRLENVPVWFKQWGGNDSEKGGHEIYGGLIQELPAHD